MRLSPLEHAQQARPGLHRPPRATGARGSTLWMYRKLRATKKTD
jgi:hypothetical protein